MSGGELICAAAVFSAAAIFAFISVMQFCQRGFLFNNAYIFASEKERKSMDKKPYYRQSAVVFCLLGVMFLVIGFSIVFRSCKLMLLEILPAAGAIAFAVVSSVKINKNTKR